MKREYYKTKESVDEYIELAKGVNGNELIKKLKKHLIHGSSLVEIGSGPGTDFLILRKYYNVIGSDFSEEFLKYLRQNNPGEEFLHLDAITLETNRNFEGIYSNKVLQHLTNEELDRSINRQFEILNSNGIICHSFWNGQGEEYYKGLLVNYQTKESIEKIVKNRFNILVLDEYQEFDKGDSLLLIGQKKKQ